MLQTGTLAFLAGILLLQTRAVLPPGWLVYLLPLLLFGVFRLRSKAIVLTCCLLSGFLWAQYQAQSRLAQRLPVMLERQLLQVDGYIASLPQQRGQRTRFDFDIRHSVSPASGSFTGRVRVSWYRHAPVNLRPGQYWRLTLRLHRPRSFLNPGAFDYTASLLQQNIAASGYVVAKSPHRLLREEPWRYPLQRWRDHYRQYLQNTLTGMPVSGLLRALIIGDRSAVSASQWQVFRRTGTVHLMAISGLHIGLVAGFVFFCVARLWRLFPTLCLRIPAPRAAAICALLASAVYAALAGFAIPTQRALIMLTVIMLSLCLQRSYRISQVLALALLLILAWDTFAVLSAGFWLSFSAVTVIFYLLQFQLRDATVVRRWWRMQLAISLALAPLLIVFFQQASLISPLTNLVAIPWVSVLVLPLALVGTALADLNHALAEICLHLSAHALQWLQAGLEQAAAWQGSLFQLAAPGVWSVSLAILGIAVLFLPRSIPGRYFGLLLCLPLCLPAFERPAAGHVRLDLLDVGQGLSAVVQTARHTLVFDTGPRFSASFDAGEAVVLPFLRAKGIRSIDALLISHSDLDHIGGARSVLLDMPVKSVISNVARIRRGAGDRDCFAGLEWRWDGVRFRILSPTRLDYPALGTDNNRSCVLQIQTAERRLLLSADIEQATENALVQRYGEQLRSDVLVIPHHGSRTSSSPIFLDAVKPRIALIPAGWQNRYHFPAKAVLARLQQRSVRVLNTAESGTISVDVEQGITLREYRWQYQRYWQVR